MCTKQYLQVLELGSYVAPAYAGMILAEQGHNVEKWTTNDPIHSLNHGTELWEWLTHKKTIKNLHASNIVNLEPGQYDVILDNTRLDTWYKRGVNPQHLARQLNVTWVSIQPDIGARSFDIIAQARAWGDKGTLPFYIGDTTAGLWLAFKALAAPVGFHTIGHATCLAKLVEGEETFQRPEGMYPYDHPGTYMNTGSAAVVEFKGQRIVEPFRGREWRLENLPNNNGRFCV